MSTARRSILFGGGASPSLLYNDEFTGTVAAPIPAGNADVRGYRVVNDVENLMTIGSDVLNVPTQVGIVWGNEYYRAQPNSGQQYWTRPSGKALVAVVDFRQSTRNQHQIVGWWSTANLNGTPKSSVFTVSSNLTARESSISVSDAQGYSASTDYLGVAVWDSTGFHTYVKISGIWHKKWFKPEVLTQAYCGMSNLIAIGSLKYFRIYAIDESLFAPALSIANPSVGNLANMPDGDFLLYLDNITVPSSNAISVFLRKKDANNRWREQPANSGNNFSVDEVVAGGSTNRIAAGGVVNTDDIITIARGATIQAWRNTTALGSAYPSAYNHLREVLLELNSLGTGGAIGALYAWKARLLDEAGLGADVVVNGTFATDTNWIKGLGWAISGGTANHTAAGAGNLVASVNPLVAGTYYKLVFTVSNYSAGALTPNLGTGALAPVSANGTYTYYGVAATTALVFSADATCALSLDDVTCEPITFTADALALVLDGLSA